MSWSPAMPNNLLTSLDVAPSGRSRPVWFDSLAYCREKLLSGEPLPWHSPGDLTAFFGKAQGMFRSDALLVDLADMYAQLVDNDDALRTAMTARARPGYALRVLLADERARAVAVEAVSAVAATAGVVPVVLSLPSPSHWLTITAEQAGQELAPPDVDRAESAAMYVADFLRTFAASGVDGLLLDEGPTPADDLVDPEAYRSVLNVADHYEWPVLIRSDTTSAWPHGAVSGVAAWLGTVAVGAPVARWGAVSGRDFWSGTDRSKESDFLLAVVPADADPEAVMQRVRALNT
jgi:hypothetical protein